MNDKTDAIRDLIMRLVDAAHREGTFTEAVALTIERQWRMENDGRKIAVTYRRVDQHKVAEAARSDYLANEPVETITRRHGISRATLYRYLKR